MPLSFRRRAAGRRRAARRRRAALVAVLIAGVAMYAVASNSSPPSGQPASPSQRSILVLKVGDRVIGRVPTTRYVVAGRVERARLDDVLASALPTTSTATRGAVRSVYSYDRDATAQLATRLGPRGGTVTALRHRAATSIAAPVIAQRLRNNCESAALSILLATVGHDVDQLRIQRALPISGSKDPKADAGFKVWGDPDLGFVGRADGGGAAGGFGVYPRPVQATAKRFGVRLANLTGKSAAAVYRALRQGHALMAWIGLSDGPYGQWLSPDGREIKVNFGEHTVVVHGITPDGTLLVSNPLKGTRERWSPSQFERLWSRLGRRALVTT